MSVPVVNQTPDILVMQSTQDRTAKNMSSSLYGRQSPVSLTHGSVVPNVFIRSPHLRFREFESHAAKNSCQKISPKQTSTAREMWKTQCRSNPVSARSLPISKVCRGLSAISLRNCGNLDYGDKRIIPERPQSAGCESLYRGGI
jgi:hypothetical protein